MIIRKNLEGSGSGIILRYYPEICLAGLRNTTQNLGQDSRSPARDLNQGPPECEAGMLTTNHIVVNSHSKSEQDFSCSPDSFV
jgi:hypothetical protein